MTPEDRAKVEEIKGNLRTEQEKFEKNAEVAAKKLHIESVAKTEWLWELEGATEEDYPQLREWVEKRFSGNYNQYFLAYTTEQADKGLLGDMYPGIKYQMEVPYDTWHTKHLLEQKKKEQDSKQENRQAAWILCGCLLVTMVLSTLFYAC